MIEAVLFDLDGTFADTAPDLAAALNHVRKQHHKLPLFLETIRPQASHGARGLLKLGFNVVPDDPDFTLLNAAFLEYYGNNICIHTRLFPGMDKLVDTLERRRLQWGIVTNKPHRFTVPLIKALGYADRAACVISGDTCARAKPYPDQLLKASRLIEVDPENCIYLGDDLRDMRAAQAAGMKGIIAQYGYIESGTNTNNWCADGEIKTPLALLDFI
jgi:phosphoglycolate phosphatase